MQSSEYARSIRPNLGPRGAGAPSHSLRVGSPIEQDLGSAGLG